MPEYIFGSRLKLASYRIIDLLGNWVIGKIKILGQSIARNVSILYFSVAGLAAVDVTSIKINKYSDR
jgi:hypothetical protein